MRAVPGTLMYSGSAGVAMMHHSTRRPDAGARSSNPVHQLRTSSTRARRALRFMALSLLGAAGCTTTVEQPAASGTAEEAASVAPATVAPGTIAFLNSGMLPATVPFSEAVRVGSVVHLSGQLGARPGELSVVPGGMEAEARQTLDNIRNTLAQHGLGMDDVVKCTVMLADMSRWTAFNAVYATYFTPPYPARSAMGVNGLALGAQVELECIAVDGAAAAKRK